MISLPNVTLISVATQNVDATARAMEYSCRGIQFGAKVIVSPYMPFNNINMEWVQIDAFPTIDHWNEYIVYSLWKHFTTDYCMLVHADGFVVNPDKWQDKWLAYDYCGSPWDLACAYAIQGGRDQPLSRVGNSVGLRSRRLCKLPTDINLEWKRFNNDSNEDTFLVAHNRVILEQHGIKIAPLEVAVEFGREAEMPENSHITDPFCFHKWQGKNAIYPRF